MGRSDYAEAVEAVRAAIGRGDVYQVNLVQHLAAPFAGALESLAGRLGSFGPRLLAGDGWAIVSASPELFLARRGRRVWTAPIKGTRPLGEHVEGEKDAAEHVMIVDLERNDLSRVCEPGSVHWPELMAERELAGVTHLVSTVEGTLRADVGLAELLAATFPGGSVTGAPKIAALDLIAALEPVGRGASMGALGVVRGNGDLDLALTIRTFAIAEERIHLWVGGGIVWDSEPEAEIEESWTKARPLLAAVGAPCRGGSAMTLLSVAVGDRGVVDPSEPVLRADDEALLRGRAAFETIRVYGGRPFKLAEHLDRLAGSAERIGLPAREPPRARAAGAAGARRSRRAGCGAAPLLDADAGVARARRARSPTTTTTLRARGQRLISLRGVRADEPWLLPGVKSTSYAVNMAAEAEAKRRGADDALFVDAEGTVLEGPTTNVWWRRERTLYTPSLDLGILAGVTRATVVELAARRGYGVEEGHFGLTELLAADEAFTSSSVREVMPVTELDGAPIARGEAADELQAALRRAAGARLPG